MPYIKIERREMLGWVIDNLNAMFLHIGLTGNLNYILYKLALRNCHNYAEYAAFIGELQMAQLEIYRRQCSSYEDKKELENGKIEE